MTAKVPSILVAAAPDYRPDGLTPATVNAMARAARAVRTAIKATDEALQGTEDGSESELACRESASH
jgi:hypothetical protein